MPGVLEKLHAAAHLETAPIYKDPVKRWWRPARTSWRPKGITSCACSRFPGHFGTRTTTRCNC